MEDILEKILIKRKKQLDYEKKAIKQASLIKALNKDGLQIIGEIKRASPSKGNIAKDDFNIEAQLSYYIKNNIAAFSILTENYFFKGKNEDISFAKKLYPDIPVLRKDFIFDSFQVAQAKFLGASAILLIARMLHDDKLHDLHNLALNLDLEVLVEVHTKKDLDRALKIPNISLLGINNRDLNTFKTSLSITENLYSEIKNIDNLTVISESGFNSKEDLNFIESLGISGVLVGESLMQGYLL